MMNYKVIPVGTWWYWVSTWQYWLLLCGTGSVQVGTAWYLVEYRAFLLGEGKAGKHLEREHILSGEGPGGKSIGEGK